nr:FAD:protein FMN transferase [Nannocystis pusilla]
MGTTWRVTVVHEGRDVAPILPMIEAELAQIDREMSTWRDDSAISEFNRRADTSAFPAPAALVEVVAQANEVSERSGGAFDVTVSPLVDAWGFGRDKTASPPTDEQFAALRAQVGWQSLHADRSANTLRKDKPGLTITLSAIAPGYAADVLSDRLVELGFGRHLVDVGGEFRARGDGPEGPWRLGIERPDGAVDERVVQEVVPLRDAALATSGDYRNYREEAGRRISHTIDPRSGRPIDHKLASVTVIHRTAALADAYATALNVLGPEDGFALAERESCRPCSSCATAPASPRAPRRPSRPCARGLRPPTSIPDMPTILLTIAVLGAVMLGMAVGAIFAGKALKGSCGGLANGNCGCTDAQRRDCSTKQAA